MTDAGMIKPAGRASAVPPWVLAVAAMTSVQLGSALSLHLITAVGPAGTAWLRLTFGALIFLVLARPKLRTVRRRDLPAPIALGIITGLQTIAFLAVRARASDVARSGELRRARVSDVAGPGPVGAAALFG